LLAVDLARCLAEQSEALRRNGSLTGSLHQLVGTRVADARDSAMKAADKP
jgi:hypothetical protein